MAKIIPAKIINNCGECIYNNHRKLFCYFSMVPIVDVGNVHPKCELEDAPVKNHRLEQLRKDIPEETKQEVELAHKLAEEAIGFANFTRINKWRGCVYGWSRKESIKKNIKRGLLTTAELYDEYLKSKT